MRRAALERDWRRTGLRAGRRTRNRTFHSLSRTALDTSYQQLKVLTRVQTRDWSRDISHSAPSARSPRVAEKRQRRREEILHAALRAFREKGFHATTLDDIAEHLGLRKTALYHYFPDKEAILWECHQESLAELERIIEGARALDTATEQLAYVIREHVRVMTDTLEGSPLAFEVTAFSPERQQTIIAARDAYERAVRGILARGIEEGEFRAVDVKIAVFAILGSINWIARWYNPEGSLRAAELGAQFADHLVGGLTCG